MELDTQEIRITDLIEAVKRRSTTLITVFATIFLAGLGIALFLPSIYESKAVILIEQQEIPSDLVRSTVTSFAEQRIQVMSQRVMSSTNLMRIVDQFDLYSEAREEQPREEILERMKSNISLEMISADVVDPHSGRPTEATIAFSLAFEDANPQTAQRVANELVSSFLNENLKSRTDSANETAGFLNDEAKIMREKVAELEAEIAKFKDENALNRPEFEVMTRDFMNRTELQLSEVDRRIHEAMQSKIYLEGQLAQHDPVVPESGAVGTSAIDQLRAVEAQLAAAEASYADTHPDVVRLRKQAEGVRATVDPAASRTLYEDEISRRASNLRVLLERYDTSHPDVQKEQKALDLLEQKIEGLPAGESQTPNNPAYIALMARLNAVNAELASYDISRTRLEEKMEEHARSLLLMPDAEAKYRALSTDYETALSKYREISAKQMEAGIAQNLETERKGEKFTLIEPPLLPERPAKPHRLAIVAIAFLLASISGFSAVSLAEAVDDRIHGRVELQKIFSAPPLATIPVIELDDGATSFRRIAVPAGIVASVVLGVLVAVHILVAPLDVAWFILLRKLGL